MSSRTLLTKDMDVSPKIAVGILLGILIMGIFVVGYDQGHLFSIVQGQEAYDTKWMHEFYHDMRHGSRIPVSLVLGKMNNLFSTGAKE